MEGCQSYQTRVPPLWPHVTFITPLKAPSPNADMGGVNVWIWRTQFSPYQGCSQMLHFSYWAFGRIAHLCLLSWIFLSWFLLLQNWALLQHFCDFVLPCQVFVFMLHITVIGMPVCYLLQSTNGLLVVLLNIICMPSTLQVLNTHLKNHIECDVLVINSTNTSLWNRYGFRGLCIYT